MGFDFTPAPSPSSVALIASAILTATALLAAVPSPASACTLPDCSGGHVLEAGGVIPGNAHRITWWPKTGFQAGPGELDASNIELIANPGTPEAKSLGVGVTSAPTTSGYLVEPSEGFEPETRYRFRGADLCMDGGKLGDRPTEVTFETGKRTDFPDDLGRLETTSESQGELKVATNSGRCGSAEIDAAQVVVELTLSSEAKPWGEALYYQTEVRRPGTDQWRAWTPSHSLAFPHPPGRSWEGLATDRLYTPCGGGDPGADTGLAPGRWEVRMSAQRPGTTAVLLTDPHEVELTCQDSAGGDTGADTGSDTGTDTAPDTGSDTGPRPDTEAPGDTGVIWRDVSQGDRNPTDGCGCRSTDAPAGAELALFVLAMAAVRRRR